MKKLTIFLLFLSSSLFSQTSDILTTNKLKEGIYANFKEFRTNSPSIQGTIEFKEKSEMARRTLGAAKNKLFMLDSEGKRKRINRSIWGFCDGKDVFVFWDKSKSLSRYFNKLITIDRYCYFLDDGYTRSGFEASFVYKYEIDYVLNINNGKIYKLDKKIMRAILKKDPELLARYNKERNKRKYQSGYIKEYCERNAGDIAPIKDTYE